MSISQCIYRSLTFSWDAGNNQILIHWRKCIYIYIGGSEWIQEMEGCGESWFSVLSVPPHPKRSSAVSPQPSVTAPRVGGCQQHPQSAEQSSGFISGSSHCPAHPGTLCCCPRATHIDQVLLEAFPQVFNECSLAGEVFQQDKVLHPDTVPGCQSALHGQPDAVGSQSLQPKNRELGVPVGL